MNKHEISNKIESLKEELKYGAGEETDFYELGTLYELQFGEKGKYKKTNSQTILDCYNKAIEQNPFYIPAVQKKAEFLCSNGSLSEKTVSEIKNEIENILKVYPANADMQVLLGQIKLFILKDEHGGLENIKKAAELDKKYEELLNAAEKMDINKLNNDIFFIKKDNKQKNNILCKLLIVLLIILFLLIGCYFVMSYTI